MFGIFESKPILSVEDTEFQIATFKWLLKHFGGDDFYQDSTLVLPTKNFFPSKVDNIEHAANETFLAVKKYAGMEGWPCKLEAQEDDIDVRVSPTIAIQNAPQNPLGTFEVKESEEVVITYSPAAVQKPVELVATFAHELAHYLTATCIEEPPGGWDNWEFATDITATFLGFGIFMANSAFNFRQFSEIDSQGWSYSRNGYLTETEHVYALAIFLCLKNIPFDTAAHHLKPSLRKILKKSLKELSKSGCIEELLAIKYVPSAYNKLSQQDAANGASA
ncbi:hypothetical protein [Arsukibacterium sp. UBA3155]|uniref:hypothetical protein n=1 Tax=Arsukibacterium sp. UBA3155 TaxID=1946058 RepID=UPI0025C35496|nr:hypothetical protein [Arsukibacterium sp. UBA3155]|tara:strand:- start:97189 stop:98019 length:831 start_codon:yes stop_codon:yes gene_type:complete